jgi:sigma-B regulation protein RsbU (phosphoserine phosphatase)
VMANVAAIRIEQARLVEVEQTERLMARDMAQAAEIQRGLLPAEAPVHPSLDIAGHNMACRTVGGDYYDFLTFEDGRIGFIVADVAGKGMPAALMMSSLQTSVHVFAESEGSPAEMVTRLNRTISARCPGNRFITLFFAILNPTTGELTYCNAGHNPPLLVRASGDVETLEGGGMILGILKIAQFQDHRAELRAGDMLAMFSDGVTESCPPGTEDEFGETRLAQLLFASQAMSADKIVARTISELTAWTSGQFADDVTLVIAKRIA